MAIESSFDVGFIARLTADEKQIQQNYRPVIGVHKWFARRPGSLFRGLLLAEFANGTPLHENYFLPHELEDVTIADPFMGGGTTLFEANRLGCNVMGFDINPIAHWIVRQELVSVDRGLFRRTAEAVIADVEKDIGKLYETTCVTCGRLAPVKYFLWVKQQRCGRCSKDLDLFPGYLVATNDRHTHFVFHCPHCLKLAQVESLPEKGKSVRCPHCAGSFESSNGPASRNRYRCSCGHEGKYPAELREDGPPRHRLFGMEYYCEHCRPSHKGRWFKTADDADLERFKKAASEQAVRSDLPCPDDVIPDGDETKRLHRWGYARYREMFNERQLLSLGLLVRRISQVEDAEARHALATVFSDSLRYQNMLCRYDTYALKCQDIFAVHGFPVGLVQCENNVLGIPGIGSGSFRHFVEKYDRAKEYCEQPFETVKPKKGKKRVVRVRGERIDAELVRRAGDLRGMRKALLEAGSIDHLRLKTGTLDGVFTDPPYFDNVQYAELMDFCYSWLRILLGDEFAEFREASTRSDREFTGNKTLGRDLRHFTEGLSKVFRAAARGLKPGAPFVFTYHHNDVEAYVPIVVAILDAGLLCTATLPCPAEMTASLHINGTGSSVMDSIVVCRKRNGIVPRLRSGPATLRALLQSDREELNKGRIKCTAGDLYCLAMGHLARIAVNSLVNEWSSLGSVANKMERAAVELKTLVEKCDFKTAVSDALSVEIAQSESELLIFGETSQGSMFDEVGHRGHREHLAAGRK